MQNLRIIYTRPNDGGVSIVVPVNGVSIEQAALIVPEGVTYEIVDVAKIPSDRLFRNSWVKVTGKVDIDLVKAKGIGHEIRRNERAKDFAPLDIEATIPSMAQAAESKRQVIRDKYDAMQMAIDAAKTADEIKLALGVA